MKELVSSCWLSYQKKDFKAYDSTTSNEHGNPETGSMRDKTWMNVLTATGYKNRQIHSYSVSTKRDIVLVILKLFPRLTNGLRKVATFQ